MSKRHLRRISQGLFLLLFLFLFVQTESKGSDILGYPVRLFLDFDPLIFLTTLLASRGSNIPVAFFLSLITVVVTIVLGRVFCGWICPLGTLNNVVGTFMKRTASGINHDWHRVKYYVLIALLMSSAFTLQLAGILDPISLLIRSISLGIYPLFNYGVRGIFDALYYADIRALTDVSEPVYSFLKKTALA
ncbi:MAG: 4Fe-4S binding protein, partial [Nitrospirota bacterium]